MPFDLQPTLKGDLIEMRPMRVADYDDLYAVASDPLIWEQHPDKRNQPERFELFFREALESGGALIALDALEQRVIGSSRFHGYDEGRSEIEIGWTFLGRAYWGGKYNGQMKALMLRHAFRFVQSVLFFISPQNVRSQRAVERVGGVRIDGRTHSSGQEMVAYQITAAAFGRRQRAEWTDEDDR